MFINLINEDSTQNEITMQNEVTLQIQDSMKNEDFNFSDEKVSDNGTFMTLIFNFLNYNNNIPMQV